jgi:hypothetical protein
MLLGASSFAIQLLPSRRHQAFQHTEQVIYFLGVAWKSQIASPDRFFETQSESAPASLSSFLNKLPVI